MPSISIYGSGGWGTALAVMLCRHGNDVCLWSPFDDEIRALTEAGENTRLLPGIPIPPAVRLTARIEDARSADLHIIAVPSFAVRETAARLQGLLPPGSLIVSVSKGIEHETGQLFSQVIADELPDATVAVLSGPSHAEEVARRMPTALVAACDDLDAAQRIQDFLMNDEFRIYTSSDLVGVQTAAALKNVIALAAGMLAGLGMGDNTTAALITRGLAEMARLGTHMGAKQSTFAGLAGLGDIVVTCMSPHSRNRRYGVLMGQGMTADNALKHIGMTVEGYYATRVAYKLATELCVAMPITEQCYRILFKNKDVREALDDLMTRKKKHEVEQPWFC